jgi:phage antirepressor YoqD-like protein
MNQENKINRTYNLGEASKVLNCGLGRNKLYEFLKGNGIIRSDNTPAIEYVSKGYLQRYTKACITKFGTFKQYPMTLVTEEGIDWLRQLIIEKLSR